MDAIRWQRLETLFLSALERDADSRLAMLRSQTKDDPTLFDEVEAMLAAHEGTGTLALESSLIRDDDARGEGVAGTFIGPYRIMEQVGHGGMGVVYRAERADGQYTQTVALKLVRSGLVTPDLTARFRSERQILARLEHPAIARLLDGGITERGTPYLTMEYVNGRSITEHCDAQALTIEQRLDLFLVVCRAVNHAHQNLVVHRDLKPSNILVTADGSVKLLDFGIARLIASPDDPGMAATGTLLPMLTPEYASPEQVLGGPITTSTDVYALGLLLYELLCGESAQRGSGASLVAMQRTVCEEEPCSPGDAVAAAAPADAVERARARGGYRPERLRRRLRGDLDTIVDTALRKEPPRRYASVEQLAGDIERHLAGLPVLARPDSAWYRSAKFLRRHRVGATAAAAIVVAVIAGLGVALAGLSRARAAETIALAEASTATSVSDFLVDLFRANEPGRALGDTLTARELLDRGADRVRDQLDDQPVVQARLLRTIARAYESLGLYDAAIALVEEELEIHGLGATTIEAGVALGTLSDLAGRKGDYPRARDLAARSVSIQEQAAEPYSAELVNALNLLGMANGRLGDLVAARSALEQSLAMAERVFGVDDPSIAGTLNNLAIVHWQEGDPAGAAARFERAIGILEREFGPDHPSVAPMLNNLALAHRQAGDNDQAVAIHERVLAIRERVLAPDHPDVAESLNNIGVVLLDSEEFVRARAAFERALAIRESALGANHEFTGSTLSNLGYAYLGLDAPDTARVLFERGLAALEKSLGADNASVSYPLLGLARIDHLSGRHEAAESHFRRALSIRVAFPGHDREDLAAALREFAGFQRDLGRTAEADSLLREADRIQAREDGPSG